MGDSLPFGDHAPQIIISIILIVVATLLVASYKKVGKTLPLLASVVATVVSTVGVFGTKNADISMGNIGGGVFLIILALMSLLPLIPSVCLAAFGDGEEKTSTNTTTKSNN